MTDPEELHRLRQENDRLKELLVKHGVSWDETPISEPVPAEADFVLESIPTQLTTDNKIALFRRLFRGREDVYALRWESSNGRAGYSPACANEWKPGVCEKPRIKCADCNQRRFLPVSNQVIYDHLAGKHTIGVYPLLSDDNCWFLAVDFDEANWRDDVIAFMQSCRELDVPASIEVSRSGNGAHAWIFFAESVPARDARLLGAALISRTCADMRQLSLTSYDRLFPNQDSMPKGGFGNLIALPLQMQARKLGRSVFVDDQLQPFADQWAFLADVKRMSRRELEAATLRASGGRHPLDVSFATEDEDGNPWQRPSHLRSNQLPGPLPESLTLVLANQIFVAKAETPQPLANRLIRLAAFQNPEFYRAQAMRLPVWNKPRIIGCAENHPQHIGLPRGCLDIVLALLRENNVGVEIQDERLSGSNIEVDFTGDMRKEQHVAVQDMLRYDTGVLCAPTAFGKTVTAAALIAQRKVSTLVLVHRTELLNQWKERLTEFLDIPDGEIGTIGGGKKKPTGKLDIAVIQSLSRLEALDLLLDKYGQIIVDECHHLSAFSFEAILKQAKSRFVAGLTATPVRRDGHTPIIFMQCGPIRHKATGPKLATVQQEVWSRSILAPGIPSNSPIQEVFRILANDPTRNIRIASDVLEAYNAGRKILVLTERTDHLLALREAMGDEVEHCFVLHGRLSKKLRGLVFAELDALDGSAPRILLATGRLIGEGFDHPPLDTLVLAMPISWKGTLQQYAGRLHRDHSDKHTIRIYDYVETNQSQLARMWSKRQRGYQAMGYTIIPHE